MKFLNQISEWCRKYKTILEPIAWFVGVVVAIALVVWIALLPRIKQEATEAATSPETLNKIAKMLRPYAVVQAHLNGEGTFEYDEGATEFIQAVTFTNVRSNNVGFLTLQLKNFVPVAPVVKSLTPFVYIHSFHRTNKFDWTYEIRPASYTTLENGETLAWDNIADRQDYEFLIEIFPKGK